MNFGEVDWFGLFILALGIAIAVAGCFMWARPAGVVAIGLIMITGALISSRSRVG